MANLAKAEKYASWLVANKAKKGTPEWDTVKRAYLEVRPSSGVEKVEGTGRGINAGLAQIAGAPVDIINNLPRLANLLPFVDGVGPITQNPVGGSQSIQNAMKDGLDLGYKDIKDLPLDQRPFARGGEVVGSSVGALVPVVGAASRLNPAQAMKSFTNQSGQKIAVPQLQNPRISSFTKDGQKVVVDPALRSGPRGGAVSNAVRDIVQSQARSPAKALSMEAAMTAGPAIGAAAAERSNPDDPTARMYAELLGGLGPAALANIVPNTLSAGTRAVSTLAPAGRQQAAAADLQKTVIEQGGDPSLVAQALRANEGGSGTAGQVSGDKRLQAIENSLARKDPEFAANLKAQQAKASAEVAEEAGNVIPIGDQRRTIDRIEARTVKILDGIDQRVRKASAKVVAATQRLRPNARPDAQRAASLQARSALDAELKAQRKLEGELWGKVDKTEKVTMSAYQRALVKAQREDLAAGEKLPDPATAFGRQIAADDEVFGAGSISSGNAIKQRSIFLRKAREAGSGREPNYAEARIYNKLANAILSDLGNIGRARGQLRPANRTAEAVKVANDFSKGLNDIFGQPFVKSVMRGEAPADVTLDKSFSGSDSARAANLDQARAATSGQNTEDLVSAQREFFLALARQAAMPNGKVDPAQMKSFLQKNAQQAESLGLKANIENAQQEAEFLRIAEAFAKKQDPNVRKKSLAAKIIGADNLDDAVGKALSSPNSHRELGRLVALARRSGGEEALAGMRSAIIDGVIMRASPNNGSLSGKALTAQLEKPAGNRKFLEALVDQGVLTKGQARNFKALAKKAQQYDEAAQNTATINDFLEKENMIVNFLARIGGANLAGLMPTNAASPLIVGAAGSRTARNIIENMPALRVRQVIIEAVKDPKLMATLLEKPTGIRAVGARDRRLNAALLQAGLLDGSELFEEDNPNAQN